MNGGEQYAKKKAEMGCAITVRKWECYILLIIHNSHCQILASFVRSVIRSAMTLGQRISMGFPSGERVSQQFQILQKQRVLIVTNRTNPR